MKKDVDIVIAGAGVVGLTLAALLANSSERRCMRLTIVDSALQPEFTPHQPVGLRVSAISAGSIDKLTRAGAWPAVTAHRVCPYDEMRVWDASGSVEGPETLHFTASEFAVPHLGFIVENELLQHSLLQSLYSSRQSVEFGASIRSLDTDNGRYRLSLSDGRILQPDLVVGADGGASFVRKQAGINVNGWRYPQSAFVTHLKTEYAHRNTAWQRFMESGPIALLPLADGRVSVVWTNTPEATQRAKSLNDKELGLALTEASDFVLGRLSASGPRASFPLQAQHAKQYVLPGLALIGDAAHSIHPLAGQGANLGIADASCLADVLTSAIANNETIGDFRVVRRFERARKGANRTMLHFIDGLNRLFSAQYSAIAGLRGTGMRLFNRSGPVRDKAVRVALGINGR